MSAPTYDWDCQKCGAANCAHTEACVGCGKSAYFTIADLPPARPSRTQADRDFDRAVAKFFPEAIPAFIFALYGPYWAFKTMASDDVLPAIIFLVAEVLCGYLFVQLLIRKETELAYLTMLAFILTAGLLRVFS